MGSAAGEVFSQKSAKNGRCHDNIIHNNMADFSESAGWPLNLDVYFPGRKTLTVRKEGKQNTSLSDPSVSKETMNMAVELAWDIIDSSTSSRPSKRPASVAAETMRRTVAEVLEKHHIIFTSLTNKLNITPENMMETFCQVAGSMFAVGDTVNWGRIVTVYALGVRFAKHCVEENMKDCLEKLPQTIGNYVVWKCGGWIEKSGGWDHFVAFFPKKHQVEESIWNGLVATTALLGLGALLRVCSVR